MEKIPIFDDLEKAKSTYQERRILTLRIERSEICIAKINNTFYAFESKCPHLKVPFKQSGVINSFCEIVCKEHGHRYHLISGQETTTHPNEQLRTYPLLELDNALYLLKT